MFRLIDKCPIDLTSELSSRGYLPAQAARLLDEGKYSSSVESCKEHLGQHPHSVSGLLIYAQALHRAGQIETAAEQYYRVLAIDPDNLVALKNLGDIRFAGGDQVSALANYSRILEIDAHCRGLKSDVKRSIPTAQKTIAPARLAAAPVENETPARSNRIPFFTETIGDIYLAQGHAGLAAEVYRVVGAGNNDTRLSEKLALAESKIKDKELSHVDSENQ